MRARRVWVVEPSAAVSCADGLSGLATRFPPSVIERRGPRGVAAEVRARAARGWGLAARIGATAGGADRPASGRTEERGWEGAAGRARGAELGARRLQAGPLPGAPGRRPRAQSAFVVPRGLFGLVRAARAERAVPEFRSPASAR